MKQAKYQVTFFQKAVRFMDDPPRFKTKREARDFARRERNEVIENDRKNILIKKNDGDRFMAVHPAFGIEFSATVRRVE